MSIRTFVTHQLPLYLYCIVGLGLIGQGIRYLAGTEIAPYHIEVIETSWEHIEQSYQHLLVGLYRGFGAGFLCVGLSTIVLALIPFRDGNRWAIWATPTIAGIYTLALNYVTFTTLLHGAAPILVSKILFAMVMVAAVLSYFRNTSTAKTC